MAEEMFSWLTDWTRPRSNQLAGLGAGFLSGNLGNAALYAAEGKKVDDAYATTQREEAQRAEQLNQTIAFLQQTAPKYAEAVQAGVLTPGDAYKMYVADQKPQQQNLPAIAQEYEYYAAQARAAGQEPVPFLEYQTAKGGAAERSLTTTWLQDANGNFVPGQTDKSGQIVASQLPSGMTAVDPRTLAGERSLGTNTGKTQAEALAELPTARNIASITKEAIQTLRDDKKGQDAQFGNFLGVPNQMNPIIIPQSDRANFLNNLAQAQGQAFLQARQFLKGQGAVTDMESGKAEGAFSRLQLAAERGDQQAFKDALDDFEDAVDAGLKKVEQLAGGQFRPTSTSPAGGGFSIISVSP